VFSGVMHRAFAAHVWIELRHPCRTKKETVAPAMRLSDAKLRASKCQAHHCRYLKMQPLKRTPHLICEKGTASVLSRHFWNSSTYSSGNKEGEDAMN